MTSLYIDRRGTEINVEHGALIFREHGEKMGSVPIAPLNRVILHGDVQLNAAVLAKLGDAGVGVIVLSGRQSKPTLFLSRAHNDAARRIQQWRMSQNPLFCVEYARHLIERKILSQENVLEQNKVYLSEFEENKCSAIKNLHSVLMMLPEKNHLDSLRGAEGAAARFYFQGLATLVPSTLGFTGRNKRPPKDPLNAVLSLSYTLLYAEATLALHEAGFDPYVGFLHQIDYSRESLSCDIVEPTRPCVDKFCLDLFINKTLEPNDFSLTDSGCLLNKAGRVKFYTAFEAHSAAFKEQLKLEIQFLIKNLAQNNYD
jgi:CRISP-associated protein Cas1